jgi:hypothetical protein
MIRLKGCGDGIRWMRIIFFAPLPTDGPNGATKREPGKEGFLGVLKNRVDSNFFNEQLE